MSKKIIILAIIITFITTGLSSNAVFADSLEDNNQPLGFSIVGSQLAIEKSTYTQENKPLTTSETRTIELTVKFKLNIASGLAKWFFFERRIGRLLLFGLGYILKIKDLPQAEVNLSIDDCPEWCTAELEKNDLKFEMSNSFKEKKVQLYVSINESAPALELTNISVKATFPAFWTIGAASNTTKISVIPAYVSNITYETIEEKEIPPLNETSIPLNITNNGNGETTVRIELINPPENWNISIEPENKTIPAGEARKAYLKVIPVKKFENETLTLKLTPTSTSNLDLEDKYLQGEPIYLNLTLLNDGSLKAEGEELPVFEILIAVIVIILVAIIALILIFGKEKLLEKLKL